MVATGTGIARSLLGELKEDSSKERLLHYFDDRPAIGSSTTSPDLDDATMVTGTAIYHFVDFVIGHDIFGLVRITPGLGENDYGHLTALDSDGFFLCTCLMLLVEGLPRRHGVRAMVGEGVGFNDACVAPRWRTSTTPWAMEALAAKPARLTSTSAASPPRRHPAGTVPCAFNSAKQKIKSAVYANCIDFGKKMAALAWKISTLEGTTRMLDNLYSYDNELIRTEVRYQKHVSSPRGF